MDSSKLVEPPPEFFDILDELIAKVEIISSLPIDPNEYDRADKGACDTVIEPTTFKPCQDAQGILNIEMMKETCSEACGILKSLKIELLEKGSYQTLIDYVEDFCGKYLKDVGIIEEYHENRKALDKVKQDLVQFEEDKDKKKREMENYMFQKTINFYQSQHDVIVDKRFATKWINARVKQRELISSIKKEKVKQNTKKLRFMTYSESQCGSWIKNFYNNKIKDLNKEASRMSILYEKKMEEAELKFQMAKNERVEVEEMLQNEKQIFESRQKQMDDYLAYKAKKAADKELRELQEVKSIMIQAWWRGVMVRCYLGSFKKFKKRARKIRQEMRDEKSQKNKSKKKVK